jgi:hypothetical protein
MGPMEDPEDSVLSRLVESVKAISEFPECRNACKKMYGSLVRRVKLLSPLFEELRDSEKELGEEEVKALESLRIALDSAKDVLGSVNGGSKLYQVGFWSSLVSFCLVAEKTYERVFLFDLFAWDQMVEEFGICVFLSDWIWNLHVEKLISQS